MKVFNAMEVLVAELLEEIWPELDMRCKCDVCKADVLALTLNRVPPRYVSKGQGIAYVKAEQFNKQAVTNILIQITNASIKVSDNPHCQKGETG
jgi:competence protein ComFB